MEEAGDGDLPFAEHRERQDAKGAAFCSSAGMRLMSAEGSWTRQPCAGSYLPLLAVALPSLGACLAPRKPLPKHQSNPQTVVTVQLLGSGAPQALTCTHARSAAPRASA